MKKENFVQLESFSRLSGEETQCWYNTSRSGVEQISVKITREPQEGTAEQQHVLPQCSQFSSWFRTALLSVEVVYRHVSKSFF